MSLPGPVPSYYRICRGFRTPNYNLLNLVGALLALSGWFQIIRLAQDKELERWRRPVAVTICAIGFAITALVKPTTAASLSGVVVLLTLVFGRRAVLDILVAGILSCLLVVLVLVAIDGDPSVAITRYRNGLAEVELLQSGQSLAHLPHTFDLQLGSRELISLSWMAALGPAVSIILSTNRWAPARMLVCALVFVIQFVLFRDLLADPEYNFGVAHWAIGVLTLTGISMSWLLTRWRTPSDGADWRYIAVFLALIFAPFAYGIGTNNLIWWAAAHAGVFWSCATALFAILAAPHTMRLPWLRFTMAASVCLVAETMLYAIKKSLSNNRVFMGADRVDFVCIQ